MRHLFRLLVFFVLSMTSSTLILAVEPEAMTQSTVDSTAGKSVVSEDADTIDRNADDFVRVSLLVADPSEVLYSCLGHIALRLECPTYDLDYVFSYEGERESDKLLQFFTGRLKMWLYAVPTDKYLEEFRKDGRGVCMYHLNLPPQVEARLWQQMDQRMTPDEALPYDYFDRGCAITTSRFLREALDTITIEYGTWDAHSFHTIREQVACDYLQEAPWSRWILHYITGSVADEVRAPEDMIVCPMDLRDVWLRAKIQGHPLMDNDYVVLVPSSTPLQRPFVTPLMVAWLFLVLALVSLVLQTPYLDYVLLALQSLMGLFMVYMVFFSNIPNNEWNWLIVPFNPLPLLTWRWRNTANLLWAFVDIVWLVGMTISQHQLTDHANLVFVFAFVLVLLKHSMLKNIMQKSYEKK